MPPWANSSAANADTPRRAANTPSMPSPNTDPCAAPGKPSAACPAVIPGAATATIRPNESPSPRINWNASGPAIYCWCSEVYLGNPWHKPNHAYRRATYRSRDSVGRGNFTVGSGTFRLEPRIDWSAIVRASVHRYFCLAHLCRIPWMVSPDCNLDSATMQHAYVHHFLYCHRFLGFARSGCTAVSSSL